MGLCNINGGIMIIIHVMDSWSSSITRYIIGIEWECHGYITINVIWMLMDAYGC